MTRNQARQLLDAIRQLVAAEIADSWKGGGDPADIPAIEATLEAARSHVALLISHASK